jgi:hypothetical protein
MEEHIEEHPSCSGTSFKEKIRFWLHQGVELLTAETIAKELSELNRKLLFSLQKFMVRRSLVASPSNWPKGL